MLGHYVAVAIVNSLRAPLATLVNVFTLALGLVCFVVAYAVADFWDSAERHFANADRTVVVTARFRVRGGAFDSGVNWRSSYWLARYLKADFPQIEATARVLLLGEDSAVRAGDRAVRFRGFAADADFLAIFDLPFLAGDSRNALRAPGSVVLTKAAAVALYGTPDAVGQPIVIDNMSEGTVTGVIDEIREPSHMGQSLSAPLRFDMLVSQDFNEGAYRRRFDRELAQQPENWLDTAAITYVLLPADGSLTRGELRRQLPELLRRHVSAEQLRQFSLELDLISVRDLLTMTVSGAMFPRQITVSITFVVLVLGTLVLGVACVNFANLATARAARRAREIGLRKAVGARAEQIAVQYLVEVCILTLVALLLAAVLIAAALPTIDAALGLGVANVLDGSIPWVPLLVLLAVVTLVAGAYPALLLSRVAPLVALRVGQSRAGPRTLGAWLVGVQFAVVAFLLIAVTVVYLQNQELERTGLGIATDPLLVVENDARVTGVSQQTLREELLRLPEVEAATLMVTPPWTDPDGVMPITTAPAVAAVQRTALLYVVGDDFFATFGMPFLAGRLFDAQRAQDIAAYGQPPTGRQSVVISRALAEELGAASPEAIVGREIYNGSFSYEIIGVVENSVLSISAEAGPRPRVYLFNPIEPKYHIVRVPAENVSGAVAAVEALWKRLAPDVAIKRRFADDYFNDSYANFARINQTFSAFALVAGAIATIGLFAIALSVANRRRVEIGVRKILGGNARQMTLMLLAAFSKPVIVANLVAWPLAYTAARRYLDLFISPIELTFAPFAACLAVTLLVALLVVLRQTLHAARVQPATVLRQE